MTADSYIQFISVLIIFIVVLVATYFVTRYLAGYQKEKNSFRQKEQIPALHRQASAGLVHSRQICS